MYVYEILIPKTHFESILCGLRHDHPAGAFHAQLLGDLPTLYMAGRQPVLLRKNGDIF